MAHTQTQVIIVGAGLSGLSAATALDAQGIKFIILEAKSRVGGKTHSITPSSGKGALDVGAAWINDTTQPNIYGLFKGLGLNGLVQRMDGDEVIAGEGVGMQRVPYGGLPKVCFNIQMGGLALMGVRWKTKTTS